jgi:short-subunit dehydrogenase
MNIIITGASRGIGKHLAITLAESKKHKIILISRNEERLNEICRESGNDNMIPIAFDLVNGEYSDLSKRIRNLMPEINILINNAGSLINKKFGQLTAEDFDYLMHANVRSAFLLTKALLPLFETNAHILNIGSMGGYQGSAKFPGLSLYSASKGALAVLSECMAEELKEHHVIVNCLALGAAQTEMLAEAFPGYKAPLSAKQMAAYIADFALNGGKYYNGKILPVSLSTP